MVSIVSDDLKENACTITQFLYLYISMQFCKKYSQTKKMKEIIIMLVIKKPTHIYKPRRKTI